jgi:Ca2+-binding RTX toxin-like protein
MHPTRLPVRARHAVALAAVAAASALALPTAAGAAVTPAVVADHLTLTGDATGDNLVLTDDIGANPKLKHNLPVSDPVGGNGIDSATDFNPTPGAITTLPADGSIIVTVNGLGGNDTINLSAATIKTPTIDGGDGDDIIVGSPKVDTLRGGAGNDRITGFRGGETIEGQDGNDVMIWNNGDGNDINEGGDGIDETLITAGSADDQMTITPLPGGRTFFDRSNAPFNVNMGTVEKLTLTSFSGDDNLQTAPGVSLPMTIDAGPGADTITTGEGPDRIVGDRGNDVMNGAGGDDTLVWNNGDGTDDMNGQDGLDRIEDNLGAADDVSKVKVDGGKVRYDRVNAPFGLNIASSEVLEINSFGGNDTLDVSPGVGSLLAITADGGSGDDRLNGGDEADTFSGGLGNDTLEPGAGSDAADGEAGDDTLRVRDGAADLARGGAGTDSAQADQADALADIESADVPAAPAADTQGTAVKVINRKITSKLKRGTFTARISVECPATEAGGCQGALSLLTAKPVRIGGVKAQALLGSKRYALKGGERKTLAIKLPKGVDKVGRRGTLSLLAQTTSKDAAGNVATGSSKLAVKLVKKAKKAKKA